MARKGKIVIRLYHTTAHRDLSAVCSRVGSSEGGRRMDPMVLPYREYRPAVRPLLRCGPGAVVIGRTEVGDSVALGRLAVLRGDGERISIGAGPC